MGLFGFLKQMFGGSPAPPPQPPAPVQPAPVPPAAPIVPATSAIQPPRATAPTAPNGQRLAKPAKTPRRRASLRPLHYESSLIRTPASREEVTKKPYLFAYRIWDGKFRDLSQDADQRWLEYYGLPTPATPEELARWLEIPVGRLAWLAQRDCESGRPRSVKSAHYHYKWVRKRSGGQRLIQSPKAELKRVQELILRKILDKVPTHPAAHGFVQGRSILTNAAPHVGCRFVMKIDLKDFYHTVSFSRVVAIFRALGYSREVAIWLARLTTSSTPFELQIPRDSRGNAEGYPRTGRNLPQGASTSPAIANLSAFGLDVRLSGIASAYGLTYTRYADDLTFSGPGTAIPALHEIIPLVRQIIRSERFEINHAKTRVRRNNQRQSVTGVVVNSRPNFSRREFDRLKAILHNCRQHGPQQQNRHNVENFAEHLRGRIAHVQQLNPQRGAKLLAVYQAINWTR